MIGWQILKAIGSMVLWILPMVIVLFFFYAIVGGVWSVVLGGLIGVVLWLAVNGPRRKQ